MIYKSLEHIQSDWKISLAIQGQLASQVMEQVSHGKTPQYPQITWVVVGQVTLGLLSTHGYHGWLWDKQL